MSAVEHTRHVSDRGRLGPEQQAEHLARLGAERFDVIVIGAGATGAGAALDAATRGLSVALLEAGDLAAGTSSRSGKTLHGGLRYLEQGNVRLVREAAHERNLAVERLCPHLTRPTPFLFALHKGAPERAYIGAGVALYDLLGGARSSQMPWHRHLSRRGALRTCPALDPRRLTGAVQYYDAIFDDARHAMLLARTAVRYGAALATGHRVVEVLRPGGRIAGVRAIDAETGASLEVSGRRVINAAGVWADLVQELGGERQVDVQPSKGIHLVVPRERIPAASGIVTRSADSVVFMRPWNDRFWIIGTTDTPWAYARDEAVATAADIDYLLTEVNAWLADPLTRADVIGVYAGVRPLIRTPGAGGGSTAMLSRDHAVLPGPEGMFTIVGGKYTTYRRMAEDVVDAAAGGLDRPARGLDGSAIGSIGSIGASVTARTPLLGAEGWEALMRQRDRLALRTGLHTHTIHRLLGRYGALLDDLVDLIADRPELAEPLPGAAPYLAAEIVYAATHEGARTLQDVLERRTHIAIETRDRGSAAAETAAELAGGVLGWSADRRRREVAAHRARIADDRRCEQAPDDDAAIRARPTRAP
ncbi:MAG: glycerol-3-phosphate dehydrogenase/oxidase [Solirubrobacteraceae bacterium]